MNQAEFEEVFEQVVGQCRKVLVEKAREYANDGDRMHNFKCAAGLTGRTPEQALWGMNVKHLVSISDMVESGSSFSPEKWDEKIGDALNYLILLKALLVDADAERIAEEKPVEIVVQHEHETLPPMQPFIASPSTQTQGA